MKKPKSDPPVSDPPAPKRWREFEERATPDLRYPEKYFRAWRQHRNMTIGEAAERATTFLRKKGYPGNCATATLSRVERGALPFSQALLEALAHVYQIDELSLLAHDPQNGPSPFGLWGQMSSEARQRLIQYAARLVKDA